jgi:superfamily I DNA/RNA helicase
MEYSNFQKAIFSEIKNGKGNIIVNAVAGSGKTFTIVTACKQLGLNPKDVKFLAFNKSIADELKVKLNGYADVSTLHAFGFSILKRIFRNINVDPNKVSHYLDNAVYSLSDSITIDTQKSDVNSFISNVTKIYNLCRVNLIESTDMDAIEGIVKEHDIDLFGDEEKVVSEMLKTAYVMPNNSIIDYTDMIVLPLTYTKFIPQFKFVFVDECQDLNAAQRGLMLAAAKSGRFVAVGDPKQAINGFCGADCESFSKIAALPNTTELPLSVNYRCGKNMIALAQEIVPQIQAHEGAIDGVVETITKVDKNTFKPNDMVLCRTSAPLVGMCLKLITNGITAVIKGGDIKESLLKLVDKAKTSSLDALLNYLAKEQEKLIKKIIRETKCTYEEATASGRYVAFTDRCNCIANIAEYTTSVRGVKDYIAKLFDDYNTANAVVFSTAHKSKGLEADRVLILLPYKLPLVWKSQLDWQYQQELNLKYVALTRAKKELIFVNIEEKNLGAVTL